LAIAELSVGTVILDREAVVLDEVGRYDLAALQQALGGRSADQAIFSVFDCLYLVGNDPCNIELESRRYRLEG
jgi:bifunctional non-homologous end joining protein LigD